MTFQGEPLVNINSQIILDFLILRVKLSCNVFRTIFSHRLNSIAKAIDGLFIYNRNSDWLPRALS